MRAHVLAYADAPAVEVVAARQVEALEELAPERGDRPLQPLQRIVGSDAPHLEEVDPCLVQVETDAISAGEEGPALATVHDLA